MRTVLFHRCGMAALFCAALLLGGCGVKITEDRTASQTSLLVSEAPASTAEQEEPRDPAKFSELWIYEGCPLYEMGDMMRRGWNPPEFPENSSYDMSYRIDRAELTDRADFTVSKTRAGHPGLCSDGKIAEGYQGVLVEMTAFAGPENNSMLSPVSMEDLFLLAKQGKKYAAFPINSCDPLNQFVPEEELRENESINPFSYRTIEPGSSVAFQLIYAIPKEYFQSDCEFYLAVDFANFIDTDPYWRHKTLKQVGLGAVTMIKLTV